MPPSKNNNYSIDHFGCRLHLCRPLWGLYPKASHSSGSIDVAYSYFNNASKIILPKVKHLGALVFTFFTLKSTSLTFHIPIGLYLRYRIFLKGISK
jgi:hypothetical protein